MKLTEAQHRALSILDEHRIDTPSQFAKLMWPQAEAWKRIGKCGPSGSTAGVGMRLAGGAYLGKLRKAGLIDNRLRLTALARERLHG